ncbi:MAG TPA: nuclear transport factor 2 family protein [Geminicoccus sp.]|jgi:hypothetical protein|uniref:nuclear transport factor 2 family protein n=1 Tax=Geminicoccus sp. TaxID=2024832 RepID=UPI002E359D04|nr:nuclear transport factor 2 family protein [Geminicoccus sp.]HEX2528420.1 nuclear transport factor 2 family protein [Geminicoccus sp.]
MFDADAIAAAYLAAWNAKDPAVRRAAVAKAWSETGSYLDPLMEGEGHDALDAMIAAIQAQVPCMQCSLRGRPESHHDRIRFSWSLTTEDGTAVAHGTDFATIAEDGRLQAVTGFLDQGVA